MIKNQLYPYISSYLNSFLFGFSQEKLEIGILEGEVKFDSLNLRPDKINELMDGQNMPFWLKASLLSRLSLRASLMNIIGERPIDVEVDDVTLVICPSLKWVQKNARNYVVDFECESFEKEKKSNNFSSGKNFKKKSDVFDMSIFNNPKRVEFFRDKSAVAESINNIIKSLFKFYYMLNFTLNLKIKNIHLRFEDDQLINFSGDIALGIRISLLELSLGSDGVQKKDAFKICDFDVYAEDKAKILISSEFLLKAIEGGKLKDEYYTNLKKLDFKNFSYIQGTKFIIQSFNCYGNFGTKCAAKGKLDIFAKQQGCFKVYLQFASGDINVNVFPEIINIKNNIMQFLSEFKVIEQVYDLKPFRKPFDKNTEEFKAFKLKLDSLRNAGKLKQFEHNRKMIVRDWIYYFYWCNKSKNSLMGPDSNPLTLEFSRFYGLCFGGSTPGGPTPKDNNNASVKEETIKDINPNNIKISLSVELLFKGININLYTDLSSVSSYSQPPSNTYLILRLQSPEIRLFLDDSKLDLSFSIGRIVLVPSVLITAEKVILGSRANKIKFRNNRAQAAGTRKKEKCFEGNFDRISNLGEELYSQIGGENENMTGFDNIGVNVVGSVCEDVDENTGLRGLIKKYKPTINKKMERINEALENARDNSYIRVRYTNNPMTVNANKRNLYNSNNNVIITNKFKNTPGVYNKPPNNRVQSLEISPGKPETSSMNPLEISVISRTSGVHKNTRYNSFAKKIIGKCEGNLNTQKIELARQKNDFNLSKTISEFNNRKNGRVNDIGVPIPSQVSDAYKTNRLKTSAANLGKSQIIMTGQYEQLNLLDIYGDEVCRQPALLIKYQKANYDIFDINNIGKEIITDAVNIRLGTIRLNLLAQYISNTLSILKHYSAPKPEYKNPKSAFSGIKLYKQLLNMKEYILHHLETLPSSSLTYQMREYMEYLRNEIRNAKLEQSQVEGYEINYFFSLFPKGTEIFVDYENFECVFYGNNNQFSGKAQMPPLGLLLKLSNEKIVLRFFDCVFELDNIRDMKKIMQNILKIMEEKLGNTQKIFLEPCLVEMKNLIGGDDNNKNDKIEKVQMFNQNQKIYNNSNINTNNVNNNDNNDNNNNNNNKYKAAQPSMKKAKNDDTIGGSIIINNYNSGNNVNPITTKQVIPINKSNNNKVYVHKDNTIKQEIPHMPDSANLGKFAYPNSQNYYNNNNKKY